MKGAAICARLQSDHISLMELQNTVLARQEIDRMTQSGTFDPNYTQTLQQLKALGMAKDTKRQLSVTQGSQQLK